MIQITAVEETPFHSLAYRTSGSKGKVLKQLLPFHRVKATGLPAAMGCVVLTSDLQGRECGGQNRLLGEVVAEELMNLRELGEIPVIDLVALAGDLYDYPDCHKRGGSGEVISVWQAFAEIAPYVVGVHGNHDLLGEPESLPRHARILDGETAKLGSLKIGGVSGIIGDARRTHRKTEADFLASLERVTRNRPDLVVLHQGPDDPGTDRRGDPLVRLSLETGYRGLTVFGHSHWAAPFLVTIGDGQAVNVDGRVLVLCPEG